MCAMRTRCHVLLTSYRCAAYRMQLCADKRILICICGGARGEAKSFWSADCHP